MKYIYLLILSILQRGVRETESSRAVYEIARTGENRTSEERFRLLIMINYSFSLLNQLFQLWSLYIMLAMDADFQYADKNCLQS